MQFFKPENYFEVRKALEQAGRTDLTGAGCDALIPAHPVKEALQASRDHANTELWGGKKIKRYRPGRRTARRQDRK